MPGGELPGVTSRMLTDTVGQADGSAVDGVLRDSSRSRSETSRPRPIKAVVTDIVDAGRPVNPTPDSAAPFEQHGLSSEVIHELRTPLTSIHGYAQVLQRSLRAEPRAANGLAVIVRESTRLSGMLSELSEFAELQSGDDIAPALRIEVDQIADSVVQDVSARDAQAHPIEVSGRGTACCNPTGLSQAMAHVLTNAVRYSEAGEPVTVAISETTSAVVIEVADRGMGVESEDAQRVYQPFQRGSLARQAGIRGLGLGLYLARKSIAQHGGQLEHRPREGGGTTFSLTVPRA